mgnify:CR=1 FL=1
MENWVKPLAEHVAAIIEAIGICVILIAVLYSSISGIIKKIRSGSSQAYQHARQTLGQGILLGLELLVAADIIHTVAVELTFKTVGVLAIIVLIRTFLSFTLDVELKGKWPWQ